MIAYNFKDLSDRFGTVTYEGVVYALSQDAYFANNGQSEYHCHAVTEAYCNEANEFASPSHLVIWDVINPEAEDESDACDWSSPYNVVAL